MGRATELIMPVKPLHTAKTRLLGAADAGAGDPRAHADLVLAIVLDTALAAAGTPGVRRVLAVSADPLVRATLAANGIAVLDEGVPRGLNGALRHGWRWLAERGTDAVIGALQADLPALRPPELAAALGEAAGRRAFCADREGTGTTLLLGAYGAPLNPLFGPSSAAAHARSRAHPLTVPAPTLRCDVDTEHDLRTAAGFRIGPRTSAVLAGESGTVHLTITPRWCTPRPRSWTMTRVSSDRTDETGATETAAATPPAERTEADRLDSEAIPPPAEETEPAPDNDAAQENRIPAAPPAATELFDVAELHEDRYINRELSWLDFNARVLAMAEDPSQPLLERAKFLAIFASNLDEFYMVRVAGLKRRDETGLPVRSADGLTPREQLALISKRNQELVAQHSTAFTEHLVPALAEQGVRFTTWAELDGTERARLSAYFTDQVFPVLTPLAVDPAHPFPYISGLSLNLAVTVRDSHTGTEQFARVKVPNNVPRLIRVEDDRLSRTVTYLPLEDLISAHLGELFAGMEVSGHHVFRVTRNADLEVEEDRDEDLLQALERELAQRRFGPPVRLEIGDDMSEHMLELLLRELEVDPTDVVIVRGKLDLSCLGQLHALDRGDLKDSPFVPATHPAFGERELPKSVFATLREGGVLVHHPYDSFSTSVQRFIEQAAADPKVLAIKQTLYRTSGDSPIVDALIDAAEAGKQVVALVELKARFDEQANIKWARTLERSGVHVVYGLVGLKTHCKTALVVRQEGAHIRRYCHIGTGNYNPKTARLYEDIGLITAEPEVGADLTDLFNVLTGYSRQDTYRRILTSPHGIRRGIVARIEAEVAAARAGEPSGIRLKVNSLVDEQVIDALYRASAAGVPVDVVVRSICALRPGTPGLSENIGVRSILGRFLEHSRIFHFAGAEEYWIGSADMMHRNLDRRVEVLVQVAERRLTDQLDAIFESTMDASTRCWVLASNGEWTAAPTGGERVRDHQVSLMRQHGGQE